jgi:hypothetical protein
VGAGDDKRIVLQLDSVGAGDDKRIVLQLDNAGWHGPENLAVFDGIRLVFQPAHSPELSVQAILIRWDRALSRPSSAAHRTTFSPMSARVGTEDMCRSCSNGALIRPT